MHDWQQEKSESVVISICNALAVADEDVKSALYSGLNDALKLFTHSEERRTGRTGLWSPAMVKAFFNNPDKCETMLELILEPDFASAYYNKLK
jgi:hypothetical protein